MAIPFTGYAAATQLATRTASSTSLIDQIDSHATLPGYIALYTDANAELVRQNFSDPSGTVDSATANVTITPTGTQTTVVAGTPTYALIKDGSGTSHVALPVVVGTSPIEGSCVISASPLLANTPVTFQNITVTW